MSLPVQALLILSYALVAAAAGYAVADLWPGTDGLIVGLALFFAALQGHLMFLRAGDRAELLAELDLLRRSHGETLKELAELKLSLARRAAREDEGSRPAE